jgi:hypothetical protein
MKTLASIKFNNNDYEKIKKDFFNNDKHYIIKYSTIYQLFYSVNAGLYTQKIYSKKINKNEVGFSRRGRFYIENANFVNSIVGFNLLNI